MVVEQLAEVVQDVKDAQELAKIHAALLVERVALQDAHLDVAQHVLQHVPHSVLQHVLLHVVLNAMGLLSKIHNTDENITIEEGGLIIWH